MRQNVFVLGATGKVGRELLGQIAGRDVPELRKHENPTIVIGLADSQHFIVREGGFSQEFLQQFAATKQRVGEIIGSVPHIPEDITLIPSHMADCGYGEELVYADVTGEKESAKDFHLKIIKDTTSKIATANKNPVGLFDYETYKTLTADPTRYRYSATTMAGLGAVPWLSERHTIGDRVHQIDASLSGTLGFITDALSQGRSLSDAIKHAQYLGFTEPDFRDDLNGIDVARKLTILAREAGYSVNIHDIQITPFLPPEYFQISDPQECLAAIESDLDQKMSENLLDTQWNKKSKRYLASLLFDENDQLKLSVGTTLVDLDSPFARLHGTDNYIQVITDMYTDKKPYRLQGPGAGLEITASVLRRDLVNLQSSISRF